MRAILILVLTFFALVNFAAYTNSYVLPKSQKDEPEKEDRTHKPGRRSRHQDQKIYFAIEDNNQEGPTITIQQKRWADLAKKVHKYVTEITKTNPMFRSNKRKPMFSEPEFKILNGEKTSLVVELNPDVILNVLSDVLKSDKVQGKMNNYAKKAAVMYRSVRNGLFDEEDSDERFSDLS